ncbi:MAG: hypothetical protein JXB45_03500 [Candidatus Krumholzibacteriota bacterium]|nr:hypothetical protein [Candidatus Krumholzibacteriota bacterium]
MKANTGYIGSVSMIVKRALEGKVSPLGFLLVLGFLSSMVLLYISLHVHFYTLSESIQEVEKKKEVLLDQQIFLTAEYNRLVSPERIIPLAKEIGMRAGSSIEILRLAYYEDSEQFKKEAPQWAQLYFAGGSAEVPLGKWENR